MKTIYIDMSYIVASILVIKSKYYNETHCTFKECNAVTNELRKKLYNVVINNNIDDHYFKICREVIVLKEGTIIADDSAKVVLSNQRILREGGLASSSLLSVCREINIPTCIKVEEVKRYVSPSIMGRQ